jgi:hypothetical protein
MGRTSILLALSFGLLAFLAVPSGQVDAQEGRSSYLAVSLSAGAGAADVRKRGDSWDFGPVFGGRLEWSRATSAALLSVDVQPFKAGRTDRPGDFRAVYLLPTYAFGSPGRRLGLGIGMGVFDFTSEDGESETKVGFAAGVSGSTRISRSLSVELGWKRIRNVEGLRANLFLLQLVKRWRL